MSVFIQDNGCANHKSIFKCVVIHQRVQKEFCVSVHWLVCDGCRTCEDIRVQSPNSIARHDITHGDAIEMFFQRMCFNFWVTMLKYVNFWSRF